MIKATKAFGAVSVVLALAGLTACEDDKATTAPTASAAKEAGSAKTTASAKAPGKDKKAEKTEKAEKAAGALAAGQTFKYMPKECKGGRFYANVSALFSDDGVTKNMGSVVENMIGAGGDEKGKAAFKVLQDGGLDLKTIKEVSGCLDEKSNPVIAVAYGGDVKNPLELIANAVEAGGKPKPKMEEMDGISYLTPDGKSGVVAAVSKNVLVIAKNKDDLKPVLKGGDGAAEFAAAKDAILWLSLFMPGEGKVDASVKEKGDAYEGNFKIVMEGHQGEAFKKDAKKFIEDIEKEMAKGMAEIEKSPFKAAAPILKSAKFSADGDALVVNITVPKSALQELSKAVADTKPEDLMRSL